MVLDFPRERLSEHLENIVFGDDREWCPYNFHKLWEIAITISQRYLGVMMHSSVTEFVSFQKYLGGRNTSLSDAEIKSHTPLPDIGS